MTLDTHLQAYATARQLREDARIIGGIRKTQHYRPNNPDLIKREARILQTRYSRLTTQEGHISIDELITTKPQHIHEAFKKTFDTNDTQYRRLVEEYDLAHKQTAQRAIKHLGSQNEDPATKQRTNLKQLYDTMNHNPRSIGFSNTNEQHITAYDKAEYFSTNQDTKSEPASKEEARENIARLKRMLEE